MARVYDVMMMLTTALDQAGIAQTTALGLESTIVSSSYPLIRVVPAKVMPSKKGSPREMSVMVYFGDKLHEFDGLGTVYARLCEMEEAIVAAISSGQGWKAVHVETVFDEDRLPAYKMAMSSFDVVVTP